MIGWLGVVGARRLHLLGARQLAGRAARRRPGSSSSGLQGLWQREHGHPGADADGGLRLAAGRHPAGGVGRDSTTGSTGHHADPRLHADHADLRLPGAAGPALPHRPGLGDDRDAASTRRRRSIRITAHGIRQVPRETIEAAESLGTTRPADAAQGPAARWPSAPSSSGINQTIMAALSMVTIAALIDAPGLGRVVLEALRRLDVGTAFNARSGHRHHGHRLDRVTTAASGRGEAGPAPGAAAPTAAPGGAGRRRRPSTAVCVYLSYTYVWAAEFPVGSSTSARRSSATAATRSTGCS